MLHRVYLLFSVGGGPVVVPSPPFWLRCFCRGLEAGFLLSGAVGAARFRSGEEVGFAGVRLRGARGSRVPESYGVAGGGAGCFFRGVLLPVGTAAGAPSNLVPFVQWGGKWGLPQPGGARSRGVTLRCS